MVALVGACLTGAAYVLVRKASNLGESPYTIMFYFPIIFGFAKPAIYLFKLDFPIIYVLDLYSFIGIFTQFGQLFLTFGYKLLPARKASSTSYIQVPFSIAAGVLIFNNPLTIHFIIGSLLIFLSIFAVMDDRKQNIGYLQLKNPVMKIIKEVCVETYQEALFAEQLGADRIELCSSLDQDGLTPEKKNY